MLLDEPRYYEDMSLSPIGDRVTFTLADRQEVWILDLERGTFSLLSDIPGLADPAWSPDGRSLAVAQEGRVLIVPASGSGEPRILVERPYYVIPESWLPDGSAVVVTGMAAAGNDLWRVPATSSGDPVALQQTAANELSARFSPDGHWLAWVSDTSGVQEVYLTSWPQQDRVLQVSAKGGHLPEWSADSRELTSLEDDKLMAVRVPGAGEDLRLSVPEVLFEYPVLHSLRQGYAPTPEGDGFVVIRRDEERGSRIHVVLDWQAELSRD